MILNPNTTKAIVVSRSWTVSPHNGNLVLSGVSFRASPNLGILGEKLLSPLTGTWQLAFEENVRGIVIE